jgi:hypothetical protein
VLADDVSRDVILKRQLSGFIPFSHVLAPG